MPTRGKSTWRMWMPADAVAFANQQRGGRPVQRTMHVPVECLEPRLLLADVSAGSVDSLYEPLRQPSNIDVALLQLSTATMGAALRMGTGPSGGSSSVELASLLQIDQQGRPLVDIWTAGPAAPIGDALAGEGIELHNVSERYHVVEAWLPVAELGRIASLPGVLSLTSVYRPITRAGSVQTQGDAVLNADDVRLLGYDGANTLIGVMSDSAWNIAASQTTGDLPAAVDRYMDLGVTDEGRAMLEIVHDVAPGARLAHHSGVLSELDFADGIRELAAAGAKVIVDDIGFFAEPFFQDGIIAQAIDEVTAAGVTYISAAGNAADLSYESTYVAAGGDTPGTGYHDFDPSAGVDIYQQISLPSVAMGYQRTTRIVLQWDQPFYTTAGVTSDFDAYLYADDGTTILASATTNNIAVKLPYEVLTWTQTSTSDRTPQLAISLKQGGPTAQLKYILYTSTGADIDEYATHSGTVVGHPAAAGAIAVGAVPYSAPDVIEPFSSQGDTTIYFDPAGSRLAMPEIRHKPDVVAPDNVSTTVPGFSAFAGTSAAAPHVAGVAGLLLSANPHLTPSDLYAVLTSSATDLGADGRDSIFGYGLVNAEAAQTAAVAVADVTPPEARMVSPTADFGWNVDRMVVRFSEPMDPTAAGSAANYSLMGAGSDAAFGTADDVNYTLALTYDDAARQATITFTLPSTRLAGGQYRLVLHSSSLTDPAGNQLNAGVDQVLPFTIASKSPVTSLEGNARIDVRPDGTALAVYPVNPNGWPQWKIGSFDAGGMADPFWSAPSYLYPELDAKPTGDRPDVAVNATGGVTVLEEYIGSYEYSIGYQMLDDTGRPTGIARLGLSVAGPKSGDTVSPRVSMNAAGQFAIVTACSGVYGTYDYRARLRLFDAAGNPGSEVDVSRPGHALAPTVASTPDGGAIVAWYYDSSTAYDGSGASVYMRRYDAAGVPLGDEIRVNTTTLGDQMSPEIASAADGSFVIVWSQGGAAGSAGGGVYFQRFSPTGAPVGSEVRISSQNSASTPHVDMAADGRFVIVWSYAGQIFALRYAADGTIVGTPVRISATGATGESAPVVGIADNGDFVVRWTSSAGQGKMRWVSWDAPDETEPMGPWIVTQTPSGTVGGPLSAFTVTFSEPVDPASFTAADVALVAPGGSPVGLASSNAIVDAGDHQTFTINLAAAHQLAGLYTLRVGPNILDMAGNAMDQNGDGTQTDGYIGGATLTATPQELPVNEGFEGGSTSALSGAWEIPISSGTVGVTTSSAHAGTYSLALEDGNNFGANPNQAAVLHLDLTGAINVSLDFWGRFTGPLPSASVQASADGVTWQTLAALPSNGGWGHYAVYLDVAGVPFSSDYRIRFLHSNGRYNVTGLLIDDVRVTTGIDRIGAAVIAQSPAGSVTGALSSMQVTFNEPMDTMSFTAEDVVVTKPGGGSVPLSATNAIVDDGDHRTFTINLATPQTLAGHYTVSVGPNILDMAGNVMNQNNDALQGDGYSGAFDIVNGAPTDIVLSASSVAENLPAGTAVGTFSTIDADTGNTFDYALESGSGSTDNASFSISGNQLLTAASFDYEAKNSYSIRVRSTDQGGLWFEKVFTITVTDVDEVAPTVTAVYVRGSSWASGYLSFLAGSLAGSSSTYGYAIPVGSGTAQLQTLPWRNINRISIAFSEDVSIAQAQFAIVGSVGSYSVSGFSYSSIDHVATWSLAAAIGPDKLYVAVPGTGTSPIVDLAGNVLDGEWMNPSSYSDSGSSDTFPSGNGSAGGDFAFRFDVLPGDSSGGSLGKVNVADVAQTKSRSSLPVSSITYRSDFDGNNLVNVADVAYVKSKSSVYSLPVNPPVLPVFGPMSSQVSLLQKDRLLTLW